MKKVLLLSCCTGEGHNSAAFAIQEALRKRGIESELRDPISFKNEKMKETVSNVYNNLIKKTPKVFGLIYKAGRLYERTKITSPVYMLLSALAKPISRYITENSFDCVICTHLFGMEVMTAIYKKKMSDVPSYGVFTDYTSIPFTGETNLTGYIIPHEDLKKDAQKKRLPFEKLYSFGIPIDPKFANHIPMSEARTQLRIPQDKKILLVMSGGVGCNKTFKLCHYAAQTLSRKYMIYVLVGKNDKLRQKIEEHCKDNPRVVCIPFTKQVNIYMNAADAIISKAGGLSSTEAAVANVPLVHLKTIPGCETSNAKFFAEKGMSLCTKRAKKAVVLAERLMQNSALAEKMRTAQRQNSNANAASDILDMIEGK